MGRGRGGKGKHDADHQKTGAIAASRRNTGAKMDNKKVKEGEESEAETFSSEESRQKPPTFSLHHKERKMCDLALTGKEV